MEINATVVYNEKMLKDFIQFTMFRGKYYKAIGVLFRILVPLLFLVSFYSIFIKPIIASGPNSSLPQYVYYLFVASLSIMIYIFLIPLQTFNMSQKTVGAINQYVFYVTEYRIDIQSGLGNSSSQIKYSALHCVYETHECLYLFLNARLAYIVDKSVLPAGSVQELRSILSKQVRKYVVCQGA